ncbi:MAG: site-2 protease family protein [Caldilineaceae bacterium]|nr:site-2 protease family protein [Caldilineaceae bacterium]HRJ41186.1 site-2 protease family protein [Caldilineaceae bacterium]
MYPNSSNRGWNSLSRTQQIVVIAVGALVLYGLLTGAGSLGRLGNPDWIIAVAAIVFVAFPVHELAHAATAVALGDPTPRLQGRYTLNPLAHIDPIGAVLILFTGFGWAKPVQWNPRNVNVDVRLAVILVALAGPVSNLLLATLSLALLDSAPNSLISNFLFFFAQINVLLFVFNLVPVPPLDGSHVLFALLPDSTYQLQMTLQRYGFLLLMLVIFMGGSFLFDIVAAIMSLLYGLVA